MDDQVIAAYSDALLTYLHKLETITSKYGLKIATSKMKTMDFKERHLGGGNNNNNNKLPTYHMLNDHVQNPNRNNS